MARVVDITEKLNFEEKPSLVIKEKKIEINDDAATVLKLLGKAGEADSNPAVIGEMAEMLFTETGKKNLDSLHLNMKDYGTVIEHAMSLILGEDEEQGK